MSDGFDQRLFLEKYREKLIDDNIFRDIYNNALMKRASGIGSMSKIESPGEQQIKQQGPTKIQKAVGIAGKAVNLGITAAMVAPMAKPAMKFITPMISKSFRTAGPSPIPAPAVDLPKV